MTAIDIIANIWPILTAIAALLAVAWVALLVAIAYIRLTDALEDRRWRIRDRDDWRRSTTLTGGLHEELAPGRARLMRDIATPTADELHQLHPEIGREDQ